VEMFVIFTPALFNNVLVGVKLPVRGLIKTGSEDIELLSTAAFCQFNSVE